jgi:DNA-binding response OmpR family regulator
VPEPTRTVAIFNASEDTVEMLKVLLADRGFRALGGMTDHVKSGEFDFVAFMEAQKPDALIWDIAPPYDRNWNFFKLLRTVESLKRCHVVLTTTNKHHLDGLAGVTTGAIEIVGKPYDLQAIADAVTGGLERRDAGDLRQFKTRD